jgi:hypothetical protein
MSASPLGGGYRRFQLDFDVRTTSGGVTRVTRDAVERRQSLFGYGELSLPLVGEGNRLPLVEALRLSAAARYENYKGIDAVATPKLGLVYAPHRDITFKYSWGRSFKIPTLQQVNQVREVVLFDGLSVRAATDPAAFPGRDRAAHRGRQPGPERRARDELDAVGRVQAPLPRRAQDRGELVRHRLSRTHRVAGRRPAVGTHQPGSGGLRPVRAEREPVTGADRASASSASPIRAASRMTRHRSRPSSMRACTTQRASISADSTFRSIMSARLKGGG